MATQNFRVKNGLEVGIGATILVAESGGNIGINSTSPTAKLDVNGDVAIASTVSIGTTIDIIPYNNLGMLSFEGSAGQLFSITNNLTSGSIFSVNDTSGIPSIDVDADGTIQLAPYGSTEYVGIGTTNPTAKLDVNGTLNVSGVSTFQGNVFLGDNDILNIGNSEDLKIYHSSNTSFIRDTGAGNLNIDSVSGSVNIRVNSNESAVVANQDGSVELYYDAVKKFETTNDGAIVTGILTATTFYGDGTNLTLTDSVALGGDTTGDYVESITGTSNQITVTGGTGEGSTPTLSIPNQFTIPQDAIVTRDLTVQRDLYVDGSVTIGGTSATIFAQTLQVSDADLILGVRTDGSGNDVSTDNTANHGGIAIASTEGNPLVDLYVAGIETVPSTYKKIMWFKAGTFSGLGTDAWLSNYAVGIGSTQFPTGTRLAAGNVQITENDISVVRDINASGIVTADSYYFTSGNYFTSQPTGDYGSVQINGEGKNGWEGFSIDGHALFMGENSTGAFGLYDDTNNHWALRHVRNSGDSYTEIRGGDNSANLAVYGTDVRVSNVPLIVNRTTLTGTASQNLQVDGGAYVSGSVGIGTTNPQANFVVSNSGNNGIEIDPENSSGTNRILSYNRITGQRTKLEFDVSEIFVTDNQTEYLRLNSTGLGIGTDAPSQKLDVNGALRLRGALYDGNNQAGSSGQVLSSTATGIDWVDAAPANAIAGISIYDETSLVGTANSVSTLYFVGPNITATAAGSAATITVADYVSNSGIATNLKGGTAGDIPYQTAADTTAFLADPGAGGNGYMLSWDNANTKPAWAPAAPATAITGLSVRDEGSLQGSANSVTILDIVGDNVSAAVGSGIATITVSDTPTFDSLGVTGDVSIADKIVHTGDTDTAIRFPGADTFTVETAGSERLRVTSGGLVGIGTDNPSGPLHVEAPDGYVSVNASGTNDYTGFRLRDNNSDRGWLGLAGVVNHFSNGSANGDIILRSQNNLLFAAGGSTTRIYVKSDGLIGIKTTSPEYSLDFGETSASTIRLVSENNGTAIRVGAGGQNDVTLLRVDGQATNYLGETDSSAYGFSLKYLGSGSGNGNAFAIFSDNQGGSAVQAFTVLQDGTIGINSTTPTATLDVNGTLNVSGVSTISGNLYLNDTNYLSSLPTNDFGSVQINGAGKGGWEGYSIDGRAVFMHDGSTVTGIYNDVQNQWILRASHGGEAELYHNGSKRLETTSYGVYVTGTGNTSTIGGAANLVLDPSAVGDNTGTVIIKGDLQVDGTQTVINSTTMTVDDLNITLADGAANASAANGAGITVDGASATLTYYSTPDAWSLNKKVGINTTNPNEELHVLGATVISSDVDTLGDNFSTLTIGERPAGDGYASLSFKNDTNAFSAKIDGTSAGINIWGNKNSINGERFIWSGGSSTEHVTLRPRAQDVLRAQHDGTDGRVGINSSTPSYGLELLGSRAWFKPNQTGASAVALTLGTYSNSNSPFYDIVTNDATGDVVTHRINRYTGTWGFNRSSPSGEQNGFVFSTNYTTGSYVGIYNTTGTAYRIHLHGEDDSYFVNDGNFGIGTDNPTKKLTVYGSDTELVRLAQAVDSGTQQEYGIGFAANLTHTHPAAQITYKEFDASDSRGNLLFYTRGNNSDSAPDERVRITSDGNVGIGTDNPQDILHIHDSIPVIRLTDADNNLTSKINAASGNLYFDTAASTRFHIFRADTTELVRITGDGDVGIGTDNPAAKLDIRDGDIELSDTGYSRTPKISFTALSGSRYTFAEIKADENSNFNGSLIFSTKPSTGGAGGSLVEAMRIDPDGNVGINSTTPTEKLDVIGTVKATDFNTTSDQNLKTNIQTIEDPLEKIVQIRGVNFEWKENNKPSAGVIAQEVEKVLPQLVTDNGTKTVNYNGLIGLLIEAVKAQQEEINMLKERLK